MVDRRWSATLILLAGFAVVQPASSLAQDAPRYRADVELMRVQVAVTHDGEHVPGLAAGDFELRVDDAIRPVEMVLEVGSPDEASPIARGGGSYDPVWRRHYMIFVDVAFQRREKLDVVREAALNFLHHQALPTDLIGLAAFGRRGVVLLEPFTADRGIVEAKLRELRSDWTWWLGRASRAGTVDDFLIDPVNHPLPTPRPPGIAGGVELTPGLVPEGRPSYLDLAGLYWSGIRELAIGLQAIEGRKHLLLFSVGMTPRMIGMASMPEVPDRRGPAGPLGTAFERTMDLYNYAGSIRSIAFAATEALRDADTAVHGLSTAPLGRFGLHVLWYLADETGGTFQYHTHHLETKVARVEESTRRFYVLGYRRRAGDPDGVNLEIEVRHDDVDVAGPSRLVLPPPPEARTPLQRTLTDAEVTGPF
jgi:VWFA-related protein